MICTTDMIDTLYRDCKESYAITDVSNRNSLDYFSWWMIKCVTYTEGGIQAISRDLNIIILSIALAST